MYGLSFIAPNLDQTGKIIWAFATYMLFNAAYSVVNIPYGSLSASMTVNAEDRTQLSVYRNLGSQAALFVAGIVVIPLVNQFPNQAVGYPVAVALLAIVGVILHLICYKNVKERHVIQRPKTKGMGKKLCEPIEKWGICNISNLYIINNYVDVFKTVISIILLRICYGCT